MQTTLLEEMKRWDIRELKVVDNISHGHTSIDYGTHFDEPSGEDFDEWNELKNDAYDDIRDNFVQALLDAIADYVGERYSFFSGTFFLDESDGSITCDGFYYPVKKEIGKGLKYSHSF